MAAQQQGLDRLGGGIDHGAAATLEEPRQFVAQLLAQLEVQIGQRLVEQHQIGVLDQGAGQRGALLLAAGQFPGFAAFSIGVEFQEVGDLVDPPLDFSAAATPATRSGEAMFSNTERWG